MKSRRLISAISKVACLVLLVACGPAPEIQAQPTPSRTQPPPATLEPTTPPLPTSTPRPTNTPRPSATPTQPPEPIVLSGVGDSVADLEKWAGPALAHITYTGGSNFAVWNYGPDGEKIDLLVNTIGAYDGTRPIDFLEDEDTVRFEVKSSGEWVMQVLPLSDVRRETIPGIFKGVGDDVVFLSGGTPDLLKADASSAQSNFAIWAFGDGRDLLINEIAPYIGTVVMPSGMFLLVVVAQGNWTMEASAR